MLKTFLEPSLFSGYATNIYKVYLGPWLISIHTSINEIHSEVLYEHADKPTNQRHMWKLTVLGAGEQNYDNGAEHSSCDGVLPVLSSGDDFSMHQHDTRSIDVSTSMNMCLSAMIMPLLVLRTFIPMVTAFSTCVGDASSCDVTFLATTMALLVSKGHWYNIKLIHTYISQKEEKKFCPFQCWCLMVYIKLFHLMMCRSCKCQPIVELFQLSP